jgi:hypothetical protein
MLLEFILTRWRSLSSTHAVIFSSPACACLQVSEEKGGALSGILQPEFMAALVKSEALRRDAAAAGR